MFQSLGFRSRVEVPHTHGSQDHLQRHWGVGVGPLGQGSGVWGLVFGVWGLGFGEWGLGSSVEDLGFRVQGSGCSLQILPVRV